MTLAVLPTPWHGGASPDVAHSGPRVGTQSIHPRGIVFLFLDDVVLGVQALRGAPLQKAAARFFLGRAGS